MMAHNNFYTAVYIILNISAQDDPGSLEQILISRAHDNAHDHI